MLAKIKVLLVVRPAVGGMKEHVLALINNLDREKFCIAIACSHNSALEQAALAWGLEVFPVEVSAAVSPYKDGQAVYQLAKVLKGWSPDIVHPHGSKAALVARLACSMFSKPFAVVVTAHNFVYSGSVRGWKQKALLCIEKYLDKKTNLYITVSQRLREDLIHRLNLEPTKVVTIYNGLDLDKFNPTLAREKSRVEKGQVRAQFGLSSEKPVVGTIARFAPQKGIAYFIEMVAKLNQTLPHVQYLIIGDGPLRPDLERQAIKLGVREKIIFAGYREDIPSLLRAMDVFVLPTLSEGLGISVLEAQACLVPVVATMVGGIPEIITHGVTGILVPPRDGRSLALGVQQLLNDSQFSKDLANNGAKQIIEKFSLQQMLEDTATNYDRVYRNNRTIN